VSGPFDKGVAELKKQYLAAVETQLAAATKAAKLDDAVFLRAEREKLTAGGDVPAEDEALAPPSLKVLRANYRAAFQQARHGALHEGEKPFTRATMPRSHKARTHSPSGSGSMKPSRSRTSAMS
jgi:hypothetical protein